jgi:uroporphyrinogen decarboxylase
MKSVQPFLKRPVPDFNRLLRVLRGQEQSRRAHAIELVIDAEILQTLQERYLQKKWIPLTAETQREYYAQIEELYRLLGYDAFVEGVWRTSWVNHPALGSPQALDTAGPLSRGVREWAREGSGLIDSWKSFESFPWERIHVDYRPYELLAQILKPGMAIYASSSFFEHVLENLLGYEGLFYALADDPALVEAVFTRWGEKVLNYYQNVVGLEAVGAIWHADDLGYKTGTILSPHDLQKYVFPWLKKFADVAHEHGKLFLLHSCGDLFSNGVIETLITEVGIDALHSFQDVILPVGKCMERFSNRIAILGGVDMDALVRMAEEELRRHIRGILEKCSPGRFALGSGNTIANYIPVESYLVMQDELRQWNEENGLTS